MTYKAIITSIVNLRPHPNASRIQLGTAAGYQVVIDLNTQEKELGLFFPTDGKLSPEFLRNNNLYRHKELNSNPEKAGFFEDNGKIRTQKFRKERSEGFWVPLETLAWTGVNLSTLKKGLLFDEINGHKICEKYYTPATLRAMHGKQRRGYKKRLKEEFPSFKEHYDTEQLRFYAEYIPEGAICWISEKCHGTSGRTGNILRIRTASYSNLAAMAFSAAVIGWSRRHAKWLTKRLQQFLFWLSDKIYAARKTIKKLTSGIQRVGCALFRIKPAPGQWEYVSGTRRVVLNSDVEDKGFFSGEQFRMLIHNMLLEAGLHKGETIFYEIVGFAEDGSAIAGKPHAVKDKELKHQYGSQMYYAYGCNPHMPTECYKVLVYRITHTNEDGFTIEAPMNVIQRRCNELGIPSVPILYGPFIYDGNPQNLQMLCHTFAEEHPSILDNSHIREGIVLRVEHENVQTAFKMKSFAFSELESIAKQYDDYIDTEEIA